MKNQKRKIFNVLSALFAASLMVTAYQNCGRPSGGSDLSSFDYVEAGETPVAPIKVEKVDRILHSRNVANALIQGMGVENVGGTNHMDPIVQNAINSQLLLSESGDYDSITGAQITIHATTLAELACERMIFFAERSRITTVDGVVQDNRRFFKGLYIGDNFAEAGTGQNQFPLYSEQAYRDAIKRMGRSLWGRDTENIEEDEVLENVNLMLSDTKANKGFRAAVVACTIMASSFDFMRQ